MPLEQELKFFSTIRQELLDQKHEGKFALIKGSELLGTYDHQEEAYAQGVAKFGCEPFLIKQVLREEPTENSPALSLGLLNARL